MSNTVKITEPIAIGKPTQVTPLEPQTNFLPTIVPQMAQVLELASKNSSSVTPREINDHLARILQSYDALTAQYGQNSQRIDAELDQLRQTSGTVSGQLHQLQSDVAQSEAHSQQQMEGLETRIYVDVAQLDSSLHTVEKMLGQQEQIITEQSQRLDQFDIAYELLDTATRGNRKRIEAVRELQLHTVTQPQGRSRYNLFYGVFSTPDAARAALDNLPEELRNTKPWVRQLKAVQNAAQ